VQQRSWKSHGKSHGMSWNLVLKIVWEPCLWRWVHCFNTTHVIWKCSLFQNVGIKSWLAIILFSKHSCYCEFFSVTHWETGHWLTIAIGHLAEKLCRFYCAIEIVNIDVKFSDFSARVLTPSRRRRLGLYSFDFKKLYCSRPSLEFFQTCEICDAVNI